MYRAETQTDLVRVDDGDTPEITASKSGTTTTIKVDGVTVATVNDGEKGDTGAEALVTIDVSSINWINGTATLTAILRVDGEITVPTSYKWTKGTSTTSIGTNSTLTISDLNAAYNCTVEW